MKEVIELGEKTVEYYGRKFKVSALITYGDECNRHKTFYIKMKMAKRYGGRIEVDFKKLYPNFAYLEKWHLTTNEKLNKEFKKDIEELGFTY